MEAKIIDERLICIDENREMQNLEKYANYYFLLEIWMQNMEKGVEVDTFFKRRGYGTIAIYGMASMGKHLQSQLEDRVTILYTIDKEIITYKNRKYAMKDSIQMLPRPDVIVITPVLEYLSIKEKILENTDVNIVSLEEVILSL